MIGPLIRMYMWTFQDLFLLQLHLRLRGIDGKVKGRKESARYFFPWVECLDFFLSRRKKNLERLYFVSIFHWKYGTCMAAPGWINFFSCRLEKKLLDAKKLLLHFRSYTFNNVNFLLPVLWVKVKGKNWRLWYNTDGLARTSSAGIISIKMKLTVFPFISNSNLPTLLPHSKAFIHSLC